MLFRFLLIVSVLLASVEGAPIGICRHDSWPKHMAPINIRRHDSWPKHTIPEGNTNHLIFGPCSKTCGIGTRVVYNTRGCQNGQDKCFLRTEQCKGPEDCGLDGIVPSKIDWNNKYIIYIVVSISIFLLGLLIGVICYSICRHLKKEKSRRNDESQCSTDGDRETSAKPLGKHEDGPMVNERDVLENANISTPGPVDIINIETDKDVAIFSDRKHEEQTKIVTDVAPHGPMVEKREILNSTMIPMPDAGEEVINMGPDEYAVTIPDIPMPDAGDEVINMGPDEYAVTIPDIPMPDAGDEVINMGLDEYAVTIPDIPMPDAGDEVINMGPDEYAVTIPDIAGKHENKLNIGNHEAPRGPLAEKRDNLKNIKFSPIEFGDVIIKFKSNQKAIINSDKHQEDEKHIPPPLPVLRKTSEYLARLSQNRQ
ncbi:uncharacterized protein LOC143809899 isoform X2 [Ranitomeya variabilis]|uniref:uncharacterized protein LOC143809899 isoform X2 n=1 Tax=Ranitomeya variabilis TaxID=490064 RepID=UPI0040569C2C